MDNLVNPKKYELRKVEELSSPNDDKCPYFQDNMMVFVSDRPGGKGGQKAVILPESSTKLIM